MAQYFSEENSTQAVLERHQDCPNPRLKEIMDSLISHLHAFIKETEPTLEEWGKAIEFLTQTGHITDDKRQEFVLLSDTLGVSMLVDAINHRKDGDATESTVLGPFHVADAPHMSMGDQIGEVEATPMVVSGRVVDTDGNPVAGAVLDVWQTDESGHYDVQNPDGPEHAFRGVFTTGDDGRYWFKTQRPESYPIPDDGPVGKLLGALGRHPYRPAHIHFILSAPEHEPVTTHLFMAGDPYLESDTVFGVKESLIVEPVEVQPADQPQFEMNTAFHLLDHDFVLVRKGDA